MAGGTDEVLAAISSAESGGMAFLLVEGEPAIGKTHLLRDLMQVAASRGWRTGYAAADPLEPIHPGGLFLRAVAALDPAGAERLSAVRTAGAPVEAQVEAALEEIEGCAAASPVVLALDDLHWADRTTLVALRRTQRRLRRERVVLVCAFREAHGRALGSFVEQVRAAGATRIIVGPLLPEEVVAIVEDRLGAKPGPGLVAHVAACGGSPLFLLELLDALADEGNLVTTGDLVDTASGSVPLSVATVVLRRVQALGPDALKVLRSAAVFGSSFGIDMVASVSELPLATVVTALTDSVRAGLLDESGNDLRFRHDVIRESIYDELPAAIRAAIHSRAAGLLSKREEAAEIVASHLVAGSRSTHREAVELLTSKAWRLRDTQPVVATELFERALELVGPSGPDAVRILAGLVRPWARSGRAAEAEVLAHDLSDRRVDPELVWAVRDGLLLSLLRQGKFQAYRDELERVLDGGELSPPERLTILAYVGFARLMTGDVAGADTAVGEGLPLAHELARADLVVYQLATSAWIALARGEVQQGAELAARAVSKSKELPADPQNVHLFEATAQLEQDRTKEALASFAAGRLRDTARGDLSVLPLYHWATALQRYLAGQWDDALAEVETAESLVEEGTGGSLGAMYGAAVAARIAIHRGRLDDAERICEDARAAGLESIGGDLVVWAAAHGRLADGDADAAHALLQMAWAAMEPMRYFVSWRLVAPDLVRSAVERGQQELARQVVEVAAEGARRAGSAPGAAAAARHCRGLLLGDVDELIEAERLWRTADRLVSAAAAAEDGARLGSGATARAARGRAAAFHAELGAFTDLARVAGGRVSGAAVPFGWESLTDTELAVVRLAGSGLTNREIGDQLHISRYTVDTHLRHVFQKLNVTTRTQLASLAAARLG